MRITCSLLAPWLLLLSFSVALLSGCARKAMNSQNADYNKLVSRLEGVPIQGATLGGPAKGIAHCEATLEVVQAGKPIIPYLVKALDDQNLNKVIYALFCLRELDAYSTALKKVLELQRDIDLKKRFNNERDLTLDLQVKFFLQEARDVGSGDTIPDLEQGK